jgi:hypothetical protein
VIPRNLGVGESGGLAGEIMMLGTVHGTLVFNRRVKQLAAAIA